MMRFKWWDLIRFGLQIVDGWRLHHEQTFATLRERDITPYLHVKRQLRILDLANGRLRPQSTLLESVGYQVYGIDLINQPERSLIDFCYQIARWIYARQVHRQVKITTRAKYICGDVNTLPFTNNIFGLASSIAAFEHFLDVPQVIAELHRVLCPGGMVWVCIHPFSCPSGGHNVTLSEIPLKRLPKGRDAWDHLRKRQLTLTVPLNEWRISQYLSAFSEYFDIIQHYCAMQEGDHLLTPEIAFELSDFTVEELTCLAYVIVARKPE